jgi:hypothetical protein
MANFRAATNELHAAASGWHALAGELTNTAPSASGLSFQPSAAAVATIHAGVAAACGALTARAHATAAKSAAAATAFAEKESTSAGKLNALIEAL